MPNVQERISQLFRVMVVGKVTPNPNKESAFLAAMAMSSIATKALNDALNANVTRPKIFYDENRGSFRVSVLAIGFRGKQPNLYVGVADQILKSVVQIAERGSYNKGSKLITRAVVRVTIRQTFMESAGGRIKGGKTTTPPTT